MGETQAMDQDLQEEQTEVSCGQRCRRNALWNIFEGMEESLVQQVAGLSMDSLQDLVNDLAHDTASPSQDSPPPACSCPSSDDASCGCERGRLQRSFSTTEGEAMRAMLALQNRHRRNAVGNLFDLLTFSQKLLLVEHLQGHVERQASGFQRSEDGDFFSLSERSSASSSSQSSGSNGSSPRSAGEIVCR